ncbi:MAG TPA: sigma-70 family RNA polymerase sigma factor [Ktedonobacteraceae bacterium]|nr:sigma-70 family RNA polymerase sigma factor [Ktedonobacteraceae bacterium]
MHPETMLTIDELDQMDDLSGTVLYAAEVKRIAYLTREEQAGYIEAAREGDIAAQEALLLNCLHWAHYRAWAVMHDFEPSHSDIMDLVGCANVRMVEALPSALKASDPIKYLMSVSANEMKRYCMYHDPLIKRHRDQPLSKPHPITYSLEEGGQPLTDSLAGPDIQLVPPEMHEEKKLSEYQVVYDALQQLSRRKREVLIAAYGLYGEPAQRNGDIAEMLDLPKETVEKYLWRAKLSLAEKLAPYVTELGLKGA